jgi:hypothetical protein
VTLKQIFSSKTSSESYKSISLLSSKIRMMME